MLSHRVLYSMAKVALILPPLLQYYLNSVLNKLEIMGWNWYIIHSQPQFQLGNFHRINNGSCFATMICLIRTPNMPEQTFYSMLFNTAFMATKAHKQPNLCSFRHTLSIHALHIFKNIFYIYNIKSVIYILTSNFILKHKSELDFFNLHHN